MFLFAGPHNWFEARYALGRLPARAGKLWGFFAVSARGHRRADRRLRRDPVAHRDVGQPYVHRRTRTRSWNTAFLFWVAALVWMRSRTNPRFDGGWVWPLACLTRGRRVAEPARAERGARLPAPARWRCGCSTANWPGRGPRGGGRYWCAVACVPLLLGVLWWRLRERPDLPGRLIRAHDGDREPLRGVVPRRRLDALPGRGSHVPGDGPLRRVGRAHPAHRDAVVAVGTADDPRGAAEPSVGARRRGVLLVRAAASCVVLWVCFLLDYGTTRRVYFTVAMLHVLAEMPFLLRMV